MNETFAKAVVTLKAEFMKRNESTSHIYEIIPTLPESFSIDKHELEMLHKFAENNSIYAGSYEMKILDTVCKVYHGDVNNYWLDSIKHDTSYAPFYPVWILSAYVLALQSKSLGAKQIIDIGSGDGRIAYCAKVTDLQSYGIEIDENLVNLEKKIVLSTNIDFKPMMADATQFDYTSIKLSQRIFTGSHVMRKDSRDKSKWGWGQVIDHFKLDVIKTITLPTYWTLDQPIDTPFIFTRSMI